MRFSSRGTGLTALAAVALSGSAVGDPRSLDDRTALVWRAGNEWSDDAEREYAGFVARLGDAVEARRCDRLDACLSDASANSLFDAAADSGLRLGVDCADLPYVLRAYFAFKRDLPFGFVSEARAAADWDPRLGVGVVPSAWRTWRDFATPRALLREMTREVHSGMYRVAAGVETGDFYPVRIDRSAVAPGAIFYDPLGHVSVVARVRPDGVVQVISGSPDGSLTWKRFGSGYAVGPASLGGGFKRFRPVALVGGALVRAANDDLPDFDGDSQYGQADFHRWVREALAEPESSFDPVSDLRDQVRGLCRDVADRIDAVELAMGAGVAARRHPDQLPANIYTATGAWELYATAARDTRLKTAFFDLAESVLAVEDLPGWAPVLRRAWDQEVASPACRFEYKSSGNAAVHFTLDDVLDRLFALSFDPYHCPELRWGAPEGSTELASCPDDAEKRSWYRAEQRLRNRLERAYGFPTPVTAGPEQPPEIDARRLFGPRPAADLEL